jgi:hypothetical protein
MDQRAILLAYKSGEHVARSLDYLKAITTEKSFVQKNAEKIRRWVAKGACEWVRLVRMHWREPQLVRTAALLHTHVVHCGDLASHSYLELALNYGERIATIFLPDSAFRQRHIITRGVRIYLPDSDALILDFLRGYDGGLAIQLEHEFMLLTSDRHATANGSPTFRADDNKARRRVKVRGNEVEVDGRKYTVQPRFSNMTRELLDAYENGDSVTAERFRSLPACRNLNAGNAIKTLQKLVPPFRKLIKSGGKGRTGGWFFSCLELASEVD